MLLIAPQAHAEDAQFSVEKTGPERVRDRSRPHDGQWQPWGQATGVLIPVVTCLAALLEQGLHL